MGYFWDNLNNSLFATICNISVKVNFFSVFHLRKTFFSCFSYFEENVFMPRARKVNSHPFLMQFWEIHPSFFTLKSLNSIVFMFIRSLIKERGSEVTQSCPTLCDPMDCSLPGSSIHGIFQARILEWFAISFSRDHLDPGIKPWSPALQGDYRLSHQGRLIKETVKKLIMIFI